MTLNKMTLTGCLVTVALGGSFAQAASLNYGTFVSDDVTFENVTESSGTGTLPLQGAPASVAQNAMTFNPTTFESSSVGAPGASIIDSQLRTIISSNSNSVGIVSIDLFETGDYTIIGGPGTFAIASVSAPVFVDIIEVDGVAIDGPELATNLFITPGSGVYDLGIDGVGVGVIWSGDLTIDIVALAASASITGNVTGVELTFDNTLSTSNGNGAAAFIKKKLTKIDVEIVPEPASAALLSLGLAGLMRRR
ncbi:MAG: PEP-CTERM sorting domain-containing protein [Phycisphaeraceae bacterium]